MIYHEVDGKVIKHMAISPSNRYILIIFEDDSKLELNIRYRTGRTGPFICMELCDEVAGE